jgi:hypothetical protein
MKQAAGFIQHESSQRRADEPGEVAEAILQACP